MIAQTVDAADRNSAELAAPEGGQRRDDPVLNYRLDVLAMDTADVVCPIGGWLYDRTAAGWDVNLLLPQHTDIRPLQILGVRVVFLASDVAHPASALAAHGLVVSREVFACDARVREVVLTALGRRTTEVMLIGDGWPLAVGQRTTAVRHELSAAARAFKGHALTAAGLPSTVKPIETLRIPDRTNVTLASLWLPSVTPA